MWNPIGLVGVITAFNFPHAVFGWNLANAMICGNCTMWKPGPTVSLITIATQKIIIDVLEKNKIHPGVVTVVMGGKDIGEMLVNDRRVELISFTGSTAVGRKVSRAVSERFGKSILELGGNNATIIMDDANLDMAIKGCVFSAAGTCG
mmetsp:Transcript_68530/g.95285  ORF Transcript_68530/g.95285 Transcript_68530/m.95285 type:complete len:148 (+) Transcript_68530:2-445(+)